jgi:pyruvate,orthophosphate dikinase
MALGRLIAQKLLGGNEGRLRSDQDQFEAYQKDSYANLMREQQGRIIQIRLLDPPLDQLFSEEEIKIIAKDTQVDADKFSEALNARRETRGVQHAWELPEIYRSQLRSLLRAHADTAHASNLRIFIPYVKTSEDVRYIKEMADEINRSDFANDKLQYDIGVTLETPTGCMAVADMIQQPIGVKYYAIGTNDLFPFLEGLTRARFSSSGAVVPPSSYALKTDDGTPLMIKGTINFLRNVLDHIGRVDVNNECSVGLCGELNDINLHPDNLGQLIGHPTIDYYSAGAAHKIPVLEFNLARSYALGQQE